MQIFFIMERSSMRRSVIRPAAISALICLLFVMVSCKASTEPSVTTALSGTSVSSETTETSTAASSESSSATERKTEPETIPSSEESESETETATTVAATTKASATTKKSEIKNQSPKWVRALSQAKDKKNTQLLIVAAAGMNKTTAKVSMHERDKDGNWIQVLTADAYVGKYGMILDSKRKEGCKRTPIGVYRFNKAFGIASDPGCAIPYTKVTKGLYWSGDQRKGMQYNKMVSINDYPKLDKKASEHLIDYTRSYQYCLSISFNEKCVPGKGSAIFLHCHGDHKYTAGCVSVSKSNMLKIMKCVKPDCVVIINTKTKLGA